jgi:hypothetical protein
MDLATFWAIFFTKSSGHPAAWMDPLQKTFPWLLIKNDPH